MHLKSLFLSMGNLLRVLITIDLIILHKAHLKDDWNAYKIYSPKYVMNLFKKLIFDNIS